MFSEHINDRFVFFGSAKTLAFNFGRIGNSLADFFFTGFLGAFFHIVIISNLIDFFNRKFNFWPKVTKITLLDKSNVVC
jgi:hypothetical protein